MKSKTATLKCSPELSNGIDRFAESFSIDSADYRSPAFNSLFTLLQDCIEKPLKTILNRSNSLETHKHLLPSTLLKVHRIVKNDSQPRYLNFQSVLEAWQVDLKDVAESTKVDSIFEAVESLLYLVYKLRTLTPNSTRILFDSNNANETFRTKKVAFRGAKNCELCWRFTQKYKATEGGFYDYSTSGLSSRFCDYHNRKTPEGLNSYMRDQRYKEPFRQELNALGNPEKSQFFPPIDWYDKFLNDLTLDERRKLAYELAHSGLNKPMRIEILKLLGKGLKKSHISRTLGISRNTVYRTVNFAEEKINAVLKNCYLDKFSDSESTTPRQLRYFETVRWGQELGIKDPPSEFARCYHKVKQVPNLSEICKEASSKYQTNTKR